MFRGTAVALSSLMEHQIDASHQVRVIDPVDLGINKHSLCSFISPVINEPDWAIVSRSAFLLDCPSTIAFGISVTHFPHFCGLRSFHGSVRLG